MSIDKVSGKGDNIEPEKKGEKKLRDGVGEKFKEVEKAGAVDPDNRRRRRESADSLSEISTPKKDYNQTPPVDTNDNRGPIQAPAGSKNYAAEPSKNYIPEGGSNSGTVHDEVTYGPSEKKETAQREPANSAEQKESELKAKLKSQTPKLKAEPLSHTKEKKSAKEKSHSEPLKGKVEGSPKEMAPLKSKVEEKRKEQVKTPEPAKHSKAPAKAPGKVSAEAAAKDPAQATEQKEGEKEKLERQKKKEAPSAQSDAIEAHGSGAQPTIVIGQAAPAPPPPSSAASSQLSHPEVARLFDQMVSHITAIASKGVKEVTITLSSGTFRGSQIIVRETSTALRHYNVELRGLTPQAQSLFEENIGSLMQLFSRQKYPFTIHRLETRHLIERKERPGKEQEDKESEK